MASLLETPPVLELVRFSKRSDLLPGNKSKNEFNARHAVFVFTFCEKLLRWESSGSQDTRVYSMYVYICIMYFTGCLRWMHRIFRLQDLKGFWWNLKSHRLQKATFVIYIELLLSILRHTLSSLNVWEGRRRLSHKNSEKKGVSLKLPYLWKRTSCITLKCPENENTYR